MSDFERFYTPPGSPEFSSQVATRREAGSTCPYCPAPVAVGVVIRICPACRAVHHNRCWREHGRCGAPGCSTSRQGVAPDPGAVLVITRMDLELARPLPAQPPMPISRPLVRPMRSGPPMNRLAITALITAIAGIPFFGLLTGLMAIGMATAALLGIEKRHEKGKSLAVAALALGVVDVLGWAVFLAWSLSGTDFREMLHDRPRRRPVPGHAMIAPDWPRSFLTIATTTEDLQYP